MIELVANSPLPVWQPDGFASPGAGVLAARQPFGKCHIMSLTNTNREAWHGYVLKHPESTLFHTLAWRDAVAAAFGHEAQYLLAFREGRVVGVLPMFLVKSLLGGRMLVSVPYGVGGGIVADDQSACSALWDRAQELAIERRCRVVDLRSERAELPDAPLNGGYVGFHRELPMDPDDVLAWLPRKARAAARNGREKYQLTVLFDDRHLETVWRLYVQSMRRLASIAYPLRFFQRLIEQTQDSHWVSLVWWKRQPVAGLVTFLFRDRVMPYFFGSTDQARRCSAAPFAYLTVMERGAKEGFRVFDFGRSRRDNPGSYDFKRFHGFSPRPLEYQYWAPTGRHAPRLTPSNPAFSLVRQAWPYLPLGLTQVLGARLARHLPG